MGLRIVKENPRAETSWFGVPIICNNGPTSVSKEKLVKYLESNGVQTRNYFAGNILMHPAYTHLDNASDYPNAMKVLDEVFFVGCSPTITDEMIDHIEEVVESFIKENLFYHPV